GRNQGSDRRSGIGKHAGASMRRGSRTRRLWLSHLLRREGYVLRKRPPGLRARSSSRCSMKPLAIVTGVGPGTGASMVRRFHEGGYQVAMLARNAERLDALASQLPDAFALPCDVSDPIALQAALEQAEARAGAPKVAVHNAVGGAFANFLDIDPTVLERNF